MKNFSVVVPVHNEEKFLPLFLKSVCSQKLLPKEMILVDDNSNDSSKKIMLDFFEKNVWSYFQEQTPEMTKQNAFGTYVVTMIPKKIPFWNSNYNTLLGP